MESNANEGQSDGGRRWLWAALAVVLFATSVGLQWRNGAYSSDIGDDPDEPAHVVTSLMMRDYLATGLWHGENPMKFAQRYYDAFPKVALGHYPPGFYLVAGVWLLPISSKTALLLLIAVLTAAVGMVTANLGRRLRLDHAFVAGLGFVLLLLTQKQSMLVMSDLMLCAGLLLAAAAFASFLDQPTAKNALLFGALAAATMLTKASGAALVLVPPIAIALTGRWKLLLNWRLWLAPVPVLLTAVPWTLRTYKITKEGMVDMTVAQYFPEAVKFYFGELVPSLGVVLVGGTLGAIALALHGWFTRGWRPSPLAAALIALTFSTLLLYCVSPSGLSARYLLPLAPAALLATIWVIDRSVKMFSGAANASLASLSVAILALVVQFVFPGSDSRGKHMSGFSETAEKLLTSDSSGRVLISSDARGEGALTAELAFRITRREESPWQVVRASKFMASSDWIGREYESKFADTAALAAALKSEHVAWVIHDTGIPAERELAHHRLMRKLVDDAGAVEVVARIASGRSAGTKPFELILCRVK